MGKRSAYLEWEDQPRRCQPTPVVLSETEASMVLSNWWQLYVGQRDQNLSEMLSLAKAEKLLDRCDSADNGWPSADSVAACITVRARGRR